MPYTVWVDDNFHYADEKERSRHGEFETLEAAIEACKKIVDEYLLSVYAPGMSPDELRASYVMFGEDPWITDVEGVPFSGRSYAEQRCAEICAIGSKPPH